MKFFGGPIYASSPLGSSYGDKKLQDGGKFNAVSDPQRGRTGGLRIQSRISIFEIGFSFLVSFSLVWFAASAAASAPHVIDTIHLSQNATLNHPIPIAVDGADGSVFAGGYE